MGEDIPCLVAFVNDELQIKTGNGIRKGRK